MFNITIGLLRISMGWMFLWAFFDKLWGLGFATEKEQAWLVGGSPTAGFLQFATKGPFQAFYQGLSGSIVVEWVFMIGLLLLGVALILGIGVRIAGYAGALLMVLMFTAGSLPPEHNPILDEHIIYLLLLLMFTFSHAGFHLGLGRWWTSTVLVKKIPILE